MGCNFSKKKYKDIPLKNELWKAVEKSDVDELKKNRISTKYKKRKNSFLELIFKNNKKSINLKKKDSKTNLNNLYNILYQCEENEIKITNNKKLDIEWNM